ncbi:MAG: HNH endonuclease, partial [Gammaproteobacteria bacterium]|nr:HNH endonuclease [Gammaproteobacteria bacterium]
MSGPRQTARWRRFRAGIIVERGERCERCGAVGSALEVHHRDRLADADSPEEAERRCFDRGNCEVLCRGCHIEHHRPEQDPEL